MTQYLLRRLMIAIPSLLGISVILFTVLALAPGDPFEELTLNPNVPPEVLKAVQAKFDAIKSGAFTVPLDTSNAE